jgi:hypothetical protein
VILTGGCQGTDIQWLRRFSLEWEMASPVH